MLVMAILLVLCVGAVSASDNVDIVNNSISDVSVSPSSDISVLEENNGNVDPASDEVNLQTAGAGESQDNIFIQTNDSVFINPSDNSVEFDIDVKNGTDNESAIPIEFTKEDLSLKLGFGDSENIQYVDISNFTLNGKVISFIIPENITNSQFVNVFYNKEGLSANSTVQLETIVIEVPSSILVDLEDKEVKFDIKVLDKNGTGINFNKEDLTLTLIYENGFTVVINPEKITLKEGVISFKLEEYDEIATLSIAFNNETVAPYEYNANITLKPTVNNKINVSESVDFSNTTKNVTFDIKVLDKNGTVINVTKEDFKLVLTYLDSDIKSVDITDFEINNGKISFKLSQSFTSSNLTIVYKEGTAYEAKGVIALNPISNKIDVPSSTDVNIDIKNVTFDIKVLDKNGTAIKDIQKGDLKLVLDYLDSKNKTKSLNITSFTFKDGKISFKLSQNVTSSNLTIVYKEGTAYEAKGVTALNPIINATIKILTKESATEYQHNYIVAQLVNSVTGKVIPGKTLYYQLLNSSMSVRWGYTTDKNGKCNVSLDYIYSLGSGYIPVGNRYSLIVSAGDNVKATGKNCTINITKCKATLSANNYTSTYASGKKFILKLTKNADKKAAVNAKLLVRVYFSSKSYQDLQLYTNSSGMGSIGVNLGNGKYKVIIAVNDSNFAASKITRYITVVAIKNAKISAKKTTAYYNCNSKFKVKMVNSKGVALKGASVLLNVYTGKKYKAITITTDDSGIAYWNVSGISLGTHRVLIGSGSTGATANVVQTYITVKKGKTVITATNVTNKYGKSAYFNITVKTSGAKKAVKDVYLVVKVYTGKTYKTYKVKTNSKGVVSLNTNKLSKGTHKVVITGTTNKYYTIGTKSGNFIVIK